MAWCPVCKCEYKEGIEKCADCKVNLVETLENVAVSDEDKQQMLTEEEAMAVAKEILGKDVTEDKNIHFIDREAEITAVRVAKKAGIYRKSSELSSENKASAYILLSISILGIIVLVLVCMDISPIYHGTVSKITSSIVLGTLFVVFIVMGIFSLKSAKILSKKAAEEGDLSKEIKNYIKDNFSAESIDDVLSKEEDWDECSEEINYFKRVEYIKSRINNQFMNLEEDYVDFICDEIYTEFFEE